ncbi:putative multidrug resistance protein EmrY [Paraburkholderia ultramafica]|uniref:Putative multidrug resistance protein EmrY n=1 Tax=Paraburkholderia ultramafica TaxID=1544867 RepID=A0A6S7B5Z9_9BURK|nr:MFS transporter [Paraburkholderia ultramafica]CAB3788921.1 putative multidrug resistance protein EmrY [Paraburkholderia ultramafica]
MSSVAHAAPRAASPSNAPASAGAPAAFGRRILVGMGGILLAVVIAQLNDHVTEIAMVDIRGAMGISHDDASWLSTLYQVTQVTAMMFAPWCATTFSLRRFTIGAVAAFSALGLIFPYAPSTGALYILRALQGFAGGCLPPMLMTVALRFLPPGIKLYGLGAYALTATFAPALGTPLAAFWTEYLNWRFLFWQIAPLGLLSILMVAWGLPQDPLRLERCRQFDWRGVLLGFPAVGMLVAALGQGTRLGWTDSPLICLLFIGAMIMLVLFLVNEWFHPLPFLKIQLLARMNLTHALITLGGVLLILVAVAGIPAAYLAEVRGYRPLQSAPLSLCVAVPQLLALPLVAALCNVRAIDCRWILATGLGLIVLTCDIGSYLTSDWIRNDFYVLQIIQIFAQPMAVIPLLMLATNGMAPADGPFASAWFNTIKGFASVIGTGVTEGFFTMREHFHSNLLVDQLGNRPQVLGVAKNEFAKATGLPHQAFLPILDERIREQAMVLASADVLRLMALVAVALIVLIPLIAPRVYPPRAVASNPTR